MLHCCWMYLLNLVHHVAIHSNFHSHQKWLNWNVSRRTVHTYIWTLYNLKLYFLWGVWGEVSYFVSFIPRSIILFFRTPPSLTFIRSQFFVLPGTYGKKHRRHIHVISFATFARKRNFRWMNRETSLLRETMMFRAQDETCEFISFLKKN